MIIRALFPAGRAKGPDFSSTAAGRVVRTMLG